MDIAASIQAVLNKIVLRIGNHVHTKTNTKNLVMAGWVALNVVSTGLLLKEGPFDKIWIQPAAGDAGGALGAALWFWYQLPESRRVAREGDSMHGAFLGYEIPDGNDPQGDQVLQKLGAVWQQLSDDELAKKIAAEIEQGRVVAVARGRAEFGPRALGHRSILADARDTNMQSKLNLKVKFR